MYYKLFAWKNRKLRALVKIHINKTVSSENTTIKIALIKFFYYCEGENVLSHTK